MARKNVNAVIEPETETFPLLVDEFCQQLSGTDRRPELIYAFACDEKRGGTIKDTADNFRRRYEAFARRPA